MSISRIPPIWILALPFLTAGMLGGFAYVTLPHILAREGMSGGRIAVAVAIIGTPSFWGFVLAPFLDVWFRRRTYVLAFGVLGVTASAFTVIKHVSLAEVEAVMLLGSLGFNLSLAAAGGWIGSLTEKTQESRLGAWSIGYNICGGGVAVLISGFAIDRLGPIPAAAVVFVTFIVPLLACLVIPAPPPSKVLAGKNFARFAREIAYLLNRGEVRMGLALLALPSASFALTNVLGGWSDDFHAGSSWVAIIGGVGIVVGGIAGTSLVPLLARKLPLRPLYLAIGLTGAVFTLALLLLPRVPETYGLAFVGENVFQSAALATGTAIIFQVIGPGNPLAATTFSLLFAAMTLPIDYMAAVDGRGYDWHGIMGAFVADAVVSGSACILLFIVFRRRFLPIRGVKECACSCSE